MRRNIDAVHRIGRRLSSGDAAQLRQLVASAGEARTARMLEIGATTLDRLLEGGTVFEGTLRKVEEALAEKRRVE